MTTNKLESVSFCEDAALSLAERVFCTEIDEQLATDIIRYARKLHTLYAAPKREEQQPDVAQLVEALEAIVSHHDEYFRDSSVESTMPWIGQARAALSAYRKQGGES